jgi:hypothetical protein
MATAANTPVALGPSPLAPLAGLNATPSTLWREAGRCPEWHSLRLFGRGRHPAGFEMGSDPAPRESVNIARRPTSRHRHPGGSERSS